MNKTICKALAAILCFAVLFNAVPTALYSGMGNLPPPSGHILI